MRQIYRGGRDNAQNRPQSPPNQKENTMIKTLFYIDALSLLMLIVIGCVGISVLFFAKTYMQGDALYIPFFRRLGGLLISTALMSISDNIFVFALFLGLSYYFLIRLMIHKSTWTAALNAGKITAKYFSAAFTLIIASFLILMHITHSVSIQTMIHSTYPISSLIVVTLLLLIAAMIQSALFPFQRWLMSSLNSPTPVSAIMHAGLVNGGGFLLARFSSIYLQLPQTLSLIFVAGIITAIIGNLWKLMQHDIKKMLACSTMAQMGFMLMQCGLGLFPAALTHLCFHSFFKAYLFLNSDTIACEKKINAQKPLTALRLLLCIFCGCLGTVIFILCSHKNISSINTNCVLFMLVFITNTQIALAIFSNARLSSFLLTLGYVNLFSLFYGLCVYLMECFLTPAVFSYPQALNPIYLTGMGLFFSLWLLSLFHAQFEILCARYPFFQKCYVRLLNLSQAIPSTTTPQRNHYHYKTRGETSCQ